MLWTQEQNLMLLMTGLTNFACFPALYVVYHKGLLFQFHIGVFTFITSFLYHSLESIDWEGLYIDRGTWHKLDNIGSITCFIMLFVYWMDNLQFKHGNYYSKHVTSIDTHLNMIGLFITMLMQAKHAWRIENTVIPILIFFFLFLLKIIIIRKARFNQYYLKRGAGMLLIAIFFFIRGLDEHKDYLRINHGMWHCFVGISSFFLWQSVDKDKANDTSLIVKLVHQPRYEFFPTVKKILLLKFFVSESPNIHKIT